GIPLKSARRGGGFYVEFGASEMIADGRIGLATGSEVDRIEADAVLLANGQRIECDLIVCATGFGPMNQFVSNVCGRDVADAVGRVWGLGAGLDGDPGPWEGELRNMWKPTAVENLWLHGGNLAQSRHYSRFLALQLKARLSGMDTPVFARQPVHHEF
ncbi:MAG: NAD(P)/FAD-dependent oxidoreductase, partial [Pikeienuella sp.]